MDLSLLDRMRRQDLQIGQGAAGEVVGIRLPYSMRILNPFPLASSGANMGDFPQTRAVQILGFNVVVFVNTTNNGLNYWTIALLDLNGTALASVNTSAIAAGVGARLVAATITQPSAANTFLIVRPTATGAPGSIFVVPELIVV